MGNKANKSSMCQQIKICYISKEDNKQGKLMSLDFDWNPKDLCKSDPQKQEWGKEFEQRVEHKRHHNLYHLRQPLEISHCRYDSESQRLLIIYQYKREDSKAHCQIIKLKVQYEDEKQGKPKKKNEDDHSDADLNSHFFKRSVLSARVSD